MSKIKSLSKRLQSIEKRRICRSETIWESFSRAPNNLETTQDCYYYLFDQGFTLEDINGAMQKRIEEEKVHTQKAV